jgi:hypothetical protein
MINMEHIEASTNYLRNGQHLKPTKQKNRQMRNEKKRKKKGK